MRPKNFKGGRCIKTKLKKCEEIARTYDKIQTAYAEVLIEIKTLKKSNAMCFLKIWKMENSPLIFFAQRPMET